MYEVCDQSVYVFPTLRGYNTEPKSWVTASTLDNVLVVEGSQLEVPVTVYDPFEARELDETTRDLVLAQHHEKISSETYQTTDHAYVLVETPRTHDAVLVVSLDNSERANKHGHPAADRIPAVCKHINKIFDEWRTKSRQPGHFMVTFLEGCRRSFTEFKWKGSIIVEEVPWDFPTRWEKPMIVQIEEHCDVTWMNQDAKNNPGDMSFCLATFSKTHESPATYDVHLATHSLITTGHGSAAVQLTFGAEPVRDSVWVVGLPLDLSHEDGGVTGEALTELARLMKQDPNAVCAVGDMNTISGRNTDALLEVMASEGLKPLLNFTTPTYFGAYFDLVPEF
jgi:hypothetical protein